MAWLTEYSQKRPRMRGLNRHGFYRESASWKSNPVVIFRDRLIAAPLDSRWVLSVDLRSGKILQQTRREIVGEDFLGRHGTSLVTIDGSRALLQNNEDLTGAPQVALLDTYPSEKPVVTAGGLVYRSSEGIFYHPFDDNEIGAEQTLWRAPEDDEVNMGLAGSLLILEDRIVLVTPTAVSCFIEGKQPPQRRF